LEGGIGGGGWETATAPPSDAEPLVIYGPRSLDYDFGPDIR
jgi:hypothetical protein